MLGGQDATYRMRAAIRAGALQFRDGGEIGGRPIVMAPAPYVDPRMRAALGSSTQAGRSGPLIGNLTVSPVEGQSGREQGQLIAGYLGARISL